MGVASGHANMLQVAMIRTTEPETCLSCVSLHPVFRRSKREIVNFSFDQIPSVLECLSRKIQNRAFLRLIHLNTCMRNSQTKQLHSVLD